jgi:hypothetical protein
MYSIESTPVLPCPGYILLNPDMNASTDKKTVMVSDISPSVLFMPLNYSTKNGERVSCTSSHLLEDCAAFGRMA